MAGAPQTPRREPAGGVRPLPGLLLRARARGRSGARTAPARNARPRLRTQARAIRAKQGPPVPEEEGGTMTANDPARTGGDRREVRPTTVGAGRRRTTGKPGSKRGRYARMGVGTCSGHIGIMTKHDISRHISAFPASGLLHAHISSRLVSGAPVGPATPFPWPRTPFVTPALRWRSGGSAPPALRPRAHTRRRETRARIMRGRGAPLRQRGRLGPSTDKEAAMPCDRPPGRRKRPGRRRAP